MFCTACLPLCACRFRTARSGLRIPCRCSRFLPLCLLPIHTACRRIQASCTGTLPVRSDPARKAALRSPVSPVLLFPYSAPCKSACIQTGEYSACSRNNCARNRYPFCRRILYFIFKRVEPSQCFPLELHLFSAHTAQIRIHFCKQCVLFFHTEPPCAQRYGGNQSCLRRCFARNFGQNVRTCLRFCRRIFCVQAPQKPRCGHG